ncbi:TIGR01777 family oxidoreductase [Thalassolituus sp. LLYu03]|uniref:TIGR01777 family oxidoreductase n=1 Tax=Thalassolituus sp. LLYu03 TaxID=3421656 RepID=UPI003D2C3DA3
MVNDMATRERILITGGSGFIGSALVEDFLAMGHKVTVLTRRPGPVLRRWPSVRVAATINELAGPFDVLVNLAGEGIADRRWSDERKQALFDSRVTLTRDLADWAVRNGQRFRLVMSGSAVGVYGAFDGQNSPALTEQSPPGQDYAAGLCRDWEDAALAFGALTDRLVLLRTGIVLDRSGGMLGKLLLPFSLGLGGVIGDGEQMLSWISLRDYRRAVHFLMTTQISGVVNMTAPQPVSNRDFTRALAAALHRPALLPLPAFVARWLFGEMADLLLKGQKVLPTVLQSQHFPFDFTDIHAALALLQHRD